MRPLQRVFLRGSQPFKSLYLSPWQVYYKRAARVQLLPLTEHSGELEVDDEGDFWADHDEDCHGLIDTEEMREQFPEGFFWDCCNEVGTAPGCTKGHHYAVEGKRMKVTNDADSVSNDSKSDD